jgi:hypothetical protein
MKTFNEIVINEAMISVSNKSIKGNKSKIDTSLIDQLVNQIAPVLNSSPNTKLNEKGYREVIEAIAKAFSGTGALQSTGLVFEGEINIDESTFPTFSQVVHNEVDESFTGKDNVSVAFEKLHALQLELQKQQTEMLTLRSKFMSFAKESAERKAIATDLIALSKKKAAIEKKIQNAEIEAQRALSVDDTELEDINIM